MTLPMIIRMIFPFSAPAFLLFLFTIPQNLMAQQAYWNLPIISTTFQLEGDLLARLNIPVDLSYASLILREDTFHIQFSKGIKECVVYWSRPDSIYAEGVRLNKRRNMRFTFLDNSFILLERRKLKKGDYSIRKNDQELIKLPLEETQVRLTDDQSLVIQAVFIFRHLIYQKIREESDDSDWVLFL